MALRERINSLFHVVVKRDVMQKTGDVQNIIDLRIRADQFQVRGFIRLFAVLMYDLHVAGRREQIKDVVDGAQSRARENLQS